MRSKDRELERPEVYAKCGWRGGGLGAIGVASGNVLFTYIMEHHQKISRWLCSIMRWKLEGLGLFRCFKH